MQYRTAHNLHRLLRSSSVGRTFCALLVACLTLTVTSCRFTQPAVQSPTLPTTPEEALVTTPLVPTEAPDSVLQKPPAAPPTTEAASVVDVPEEITPPSKTPTTTPKVAAPPSKATKATPKAAPPVKGDKICA